MEKLSIYDKILSPVVTEKSTNLSEQNKIIFIHHTQQLFLIRFNSNQLKLSLTGIN